MGGILSMILVILGALYFFAMKMSGNKKALEQDDFAGGAAWYVVFFVGVIVSLFILSFIRTYLDTLEKPIRLVAQIIVGLIFIYIPYKIACLVAPAKDQNKKNNEKQK